MDDAEFRPSLPASHASRLRRPQRAFHAVDANSEGETRGRTMRKHFGKRATRARERARRREHCRCARGLWTESSRQGKEHASRPYSRGDNPETRGRRDERRIATRQRQPASQRGKPTIADSATGARRPQPSRQQFPGPPGAADHGGAATLTVTNGTTNAPGTSSRSQERHVLYIHHRPVHHETHQRASGCQRSEGTGNHRVRRRTQRQRKSGAHH